MLPGTILENRPLCYSSPFPQPAQQLLADSVASTVSFKFNIIRTLPEGTPSTKVK